MRALLYYTVKRERYSSAFCVMRVTCHGRGGRINGSVEGVATRTTPEFTIGRFASEDDAYNACKALILLWQTFDNPLRDAKARIKEIELERNAVVDRMIAEITGKVSNASV